MESENLPEENYTVPDEVIEPVYATASLGKRVANYLIDSMAIVLLSIFILFLLGVFFLPESLPGLQESPDIFAQVYILSILFSYYVFMESVFGRTVGKFMTGTRVVDQWGKFPSLKTVLLRTIIRFVPFELFSYFGDDVRGWHDRWSNTHVIDM